MTTIKPDDPDSPTASSASRKNKLGYTRTSVACEHCRRRKIRCIRAEGDDQDRCANCIKLKKECIFTAIDPNAASDSKVKGKKPTSSQPSSAVSRSPSGHSQDMFDTAARGVQGYERGPQGATTGMPGDPGLPQYSGMLAPGNLQRPANVDVTGLHSQDWQSDQVDQFTSQISPAWSAHPSHMAGYGQGQMAQSQGPQYPFLEHARTEPVQMPSWTSGEATMTTGYAAQHTLPPLYNQHQQHPQQRSFTAPYGSYSGPPAHPTVPSQVYSQVPGAMHADPRGYGYISAAPHDPTQPGFSRHDSMAAHWARQQSYSSSQNPSLYGQQYRQSKDESDSPG